MQNDSTTQRRITDLKPFETGLTTAWSLIFAGDVLLIRVIAPIEPHEDGTSDIQVQRTPGGYVVNRWSKGLMSIREFSPFGIIGADHRTAVNFETQQELQKHPEYFARCELG